jgi:hypothetical protein
MQARSEPRPTLTVSKARLELSALKDIEEAVKIQLTLVRKRRRELLKAHPKLKPAAC